MLRTIISILAAILIMSGALCAQTERNLTAPDAEWLTSDGVLFEQGGIKGSGTGQFEPFVRLGASSTEQGYNTDYRPVQFDELTAANWTHALYYYSVPAVVIEGVGYHEIKLDINESGGNKSFLSLDELKLYETDDPNLHNYPVSWPTPIFDLGNNYIKLDASLSSGLGGSDMSMYVPDALFTHNPDGTHAHSYLTLYSKFGVHIASEDGYEDWGVIVPNGPVPEPSGLLALTCGLAGLAGFMWRRRK